MEWEFQSQEHMHSLLVGQYFGTDPEIVSRRVIDSRRQMAQYILTVLKIKPQHTGVEIGSGNGLVAKELSPHVRHLQCYDVSTSFLEKAQETCRGCKNVEFFKIEKGVLAAAQHQSLDFIYSHAVFIHLNYYQIYQYLLEAKRCLKKGGLMYFEFLSADSLNLKDPLFVENQELYQRDPKHLVTLLQYNSKTSIFQLIKSLGFVTFLSQSSPHGIVAVVIQKPQFIWPIEKVRSAAHWMQVFPYRAWGVIKNWWRSRPY
jgi:ubiquinone/menaquinone biosynthesis C-methylase UbiE